MYSFLRNQSFDAETQPQKPTTSSTEVLVLKTVLSCPFEAIISTLMLLLSNIHWISIIILLLCSNIYPSSAISTADKYCASGSTSSILDGTYQYWYWNSSINAVIFYNQDNKRYLFPNIQTSNNHQYLINSYTDEDSAEGGCNIGVPASDYQFDPNDCLTNWLYYDTQWNDDPNMRIVKCNDICITGSNYPALDGVYIWSHYDLTKRGSIYFCEACGTGAHVGQYLYPYVWGDNTYRYYIGEDYTDANLWSYCFIPVQTSPYIFNLSDCDYWHTYYNEAWASDDQVVQECAYDTLGDCTEQSLYANTEALIGIYNNMVFTFDVVVHNYCTWDYGWCVLFHIGDQTSWHTQIYSRYPGIWLHKITNVTQFFYVSFSNLENPDPAFQITTLPVTLDTQYSFEIKITQNAFILSINGNAYYCDDAYPNHHTIYNGLQDLSLAINTVWYTAADVTITNLEVIETCNTIVDCSTDHPTLVPSETPSKYPSVSPSNHPSEYPTYSTSDTPTHDAHTSVDPTIDPTVEPTTIPTSEPTVNPTEHPTVGPGINHTEFTTVTSTVYTTVSDATQTLPETSAPSGVPSTDPTYTPTLTINPTSHPITNNPTETHTSTPTISPTLCLDYDSSYSSMDGTDILYNLTINQHINDVLEYIDSMDGVAQYNTGECDDNVEANICFIHCINENDCESISIIPQSMSELFVICTDRFSCKSMYINISDTNIDTLTMLCAHKLSCDSVTIKIIPQKQMQIQIDCMETLSCQGMSVDLYIESTVNTAIDINMSITCYDDHSCDNMNINAKDNVDDIYMLFQMYRYSDNVYIIHPNYENINVLCNAPDETRYIRYSADLTPAEILKLAQNEYESLRLPCEDIYIDCSLDDVSRDCIMVYSLSETIASLLDIDPVFTKTDCFWMNINTVYTVIMDMTIDLKDDNTNAVGIESYTKEIIGTVAAVMLCILLLVIGSIWVYCKRKYPIKHLKNPMVVLIGIGKYDKDPNAPNVDIDLDVSIDIHNLLGLFRDELNYQTFPRHTRFYWPKLDLLKLLNKQGRILEDSLQHKDVDSFDGLFVVISCHGMEHCIITSDREQINKDVIHRIFSKDHPLSREIPRIVLYDCCDGPEYRKGLELMDIGKPSQAMLKKVYSVDDIPQRRQSAQWEHGHHNPDHLLATIYAANVGFQSRMNRENGSYMIHKFVEKTKDTLKKDGANQCIYETFDDIQTELGDKKQLPVFMYNNGTRYIKLKRRKDVLPPFPRCETKEEDTIYTVNDEHKHDLESEEDPQVPEESEEKQEEYDQGKGVPAKIKMVKVTTTSHSDKVTANDTEDDVSTHDELVALAMSYFEDQIEDAQIE